MKRKVLIFPIIIDVQSYVSFEIKLPSHVERVTGITFTNTVCDPAYTSRIGTISLQSNESCDLFLQTELFQDSVGMSDLGILEIGANSGEAWITGRTPKKARINIDGSTGTIT